MDNPSEQVMSKEEAMSTDDGHPNESSISKVGVKRPLDSAEEKTAEKEVGKDVSEPKKTKKKKLNDAASSGKVAASTMDGEDEDDEDKDKKRKKPSKKQLKMMKEMLKRKAEEKEMLEKEEEENRKLEEEKEKEALEKQRLEQEKKEKKKLKEKQKKVQLKAEGKLLSKSQKLAKSKREATLIALRQQGVDVPEVGEKRTRVQPKNKEKKSEEKVSEESQSESKDSSEPSVDAETADAERKSDEDCLGESDKENSSQSSSENKLERSILKECWDDSDEEESSSEEPESEDLKKKEDDDAVVAKKKKDSAKLRSPVVCVLGHVDTGKTKLLDFIRKTHVQDSEAGGITQQIGATMIPQEALREKCKHEYEFSAFDLKVPGLLVIDTPGHESFKNLRSRGSSMCDIAILVVDIMHGLEPQTLESINLLKKSKTPFVVALNKVDRLYGWKTDKDGNIADIVKSQNPTTQKEFKKRCQEIIVEFAKECLNAALYYENPDSRTFVSMVPTSAVSGDGMGNLLSLVTRLTQSLMHKKLVLGEELQATVLEVKAIPGLGTTIDVILVNGTLREGDTIVLAGHDGPVVAQIRSLLMPHPLKELRVKNQYVEHKMIEGAQGVKITGKDLDQAIAGLPLFVAPKPTDVEPLKEKVASMLEQAVSCIKTSERGVYVQASTFGSLEAFLEYLTSIDIPYFAVKIGPVVKKDVMKASVMLEHDPQYATILAFDVKVEKDVQEFANSLGVTIFPVDIIYHAGDAFAKHREVHQKKREEALSNAVFPCVLKVLSSGSTSFKIGVEQGSLRVGTPLCVKNKSNVDMGVVTAMSSLPDSTPVAIAREGEKVQVQVKQQKTADKVSVSFGDGLISRVTRKSYEVCKQHCKDDLSVEEWNLLVELRMVLSLNE